MARVMLVTAPLEAQYETALPPPLRPQPELVLIIAPPPAFSKSGLAYLLITKIDLTLTAMTLSHSASAVWRTSARRMIPALLNRICSPPNAATVFSTAARQSAAEVTSQW